jgi:hypothetical protein
MRVSELVRADGPQVVGDEVRPLDLQRVQQREQVVEVGVPLDSRLVGRGPSGAPQVRAEDLVPGVGDHRGDLAPLPPVRRETVQEHDRVALADGRDMAEQPRCLDGEMLEAGYRRHGRLPGRRLRSHRADLACLHDASAHRILRS